MLDRILDAAYTLMGVGLPVLVIWMFVDIQKIKKYLKDASETYNKL